jgi:hypothetical protein
VSRHLIVFAAFLSGCVATDVGNPQTEEKTQAEIRLQAYEEEHPAALTLSDEVTITHAWIAIDETTFEHCEDESETESAEDESDTDSSETDSESEDEYVLLQDAVVVSDLISGTSFPDPIRLGQSGTEFCKLSFIIRPVGADELPAGAPEDMIGYSMLVRGTRKDGTPFVVRAGFEEEVEMEGAIRLMSDQPEPLFLGFSANTWLPQRQLGALVGDLIEIDIDTNPMVYASFVEAVPSSARLFEDDGDGRLEPEETLSPIAVPAN